MMRKTLLALSLAFALPAVSSAQKWSGGAASGPFVFGRFIERTTPIITERIHDGRNPISFLV